MTRTCIGRGKPKNTDHEEMEEAKNGYLPRENQPQDKIEMTFDDKMIKTAADVSNQHTKAKETIIKKKAAHNKSSLSYYERNKSEVLKKLHAKRAKDAAAKKAREQTHTPQENSGKDKPLQQLQETNHSQADKSQ